MVKKKKRQLKKIIEDICGQAKHVLTRLHSATTRYLYKESRLSNSDFWRAELDKRDSLQRVKYE